MKKRKVILATCMAVLMLTGCGSVSKDSMATMDIGYTNEAVTESYNGAMGGVDWSPAEMEEMPAEEAGATAENADGQLLSERKLIKNVDLEVETKEYDKLLNALDTQIQNLGGYIENMDSYNGSSYNSYRNTRYANLTIRIPQNKLESFLSEVSGICNVVRRSDSVNDVTLRYVDLESHKEALKTEYTRLLELMEKAETMEDILIIEERMTNVRYQMESMESQLRTMDNQVNYSTVYLNISEVQELTQVEEVQETTWQRISGGFMHSLRSVGHFFAELGIWVLVHIPQLVIWAAVITAVVVLIKVKLKKRAQKNNLK